MGTAPSRISSPSTSAGEAAAVAEMHFDRADIGAEMPDSVSRGDFAFFEALELQLNCEVFRNAKMERTRIDQGIHYQRRKAAVARIAQCDICTDQPH
jgi:hypothetical protein